MDKRTRPLHMLPIREWRVATTLDSAGIEDLNNINNRIGNRSELNSVT